MQLRNYVHHLHVTDGLPVTVLEASSAFLLLTTLLNSAWLAYKGSVASYGRKQSPAEWCQGCKA